MHLRASQPGGFVEDDGIIDLEQTPADIVVMSAADSSLAVMASAVESLPEHYPSVRLANWMQLLKPAAFDLYEDKVLNHAKVVVVSVLGGRSYWPYGLEQLQAWQAAKPGRTLIVVPGDDTPDQDLFDACASYSDSERIPLPQADAERVWQCLRQSGVSNNLSLFGFLASQYLDADFVWREPEPLPRCMMYMPAGHFHRSEHSPAKRPPTKRSLPKHGQSTLAEWQQHWQANDIDGPVALLLFYRSHLQSANTGMFDAFIDVLEAQGVRVLPLSIVSLKDPESLALVQQIIHSSQAQLVINSTGFASNKVDSPDLSTLPTEFTSPLANAEGVALPVLQVILSSSTQEDWLEQAQGLRSRDIAMQIVLPEMDGRIISRAISFKAEAYYSERCQISLVSYQLHHERATFVAGLAQRLLELANKPNANRRMAVILANYPTKDGRIGNGVGLDTPASTVNILHALQQAGYPLAGINAEELPNTGNELIELLLESVTNNPNTLHMLPCWQSLAVTDYRELFAQLPDECQQAVLERWGEPEADPKCRDGRLMIAGVRLGETFVGIQPARGYNLDLSANYHDPDLIPPHSYLAFYFWLRHQYQVQAVIHVGKHGNLEWLPGKGTALSGQCWPDLILGPTPHFYPFIVNDPGEGAQAKRRTQAVIVDHLMPPMARADMYGALADLEGLVDEYYQTMGLDTRRETWLRGQIIEQAQSLHLLDEIASDATGSLSENYMLDELGAYLCEIKESQIRHGLHILGELGPQNKLAETLVALVRLPRGGSAAEQGILHNLMADLGLEDESLEEEGFDPLLAGSELWLGNKPARLAAVSDRPWRTHADTRERLELLALHFCQLLLDGNSLSADLKALYPQTTAQLEFIQQTLLPALRKSAELELSSIIGGLAGEFVPPGPSGAPTRGRLDTLPTGRNFYSVDNRAIPSPAAWAIGQRSAQALIERHLQEHGDFPKQLGLSVWGTATMRTGGDDIAQAFWLMGVKPIWAKGSNRVTDFEIIPTQLLQRPRVDVTLRVSGFFRDAFANVMQIYDAAVKALANYDESGGANTIQQNIRARQAELEAEGLSPEAASRQASYRVFGSKPGAYGAGLQGLIDERCWEERSDLAEAYVNWGGYAYGADKASQQGVPAPQAFSHRLSQLEAVVQNQDNREHDLLDSDDYYQFQGGMTNAVTVLSGNAPEVYHNDHSNPCAPKIRTLKEELNRVIRARVLNPKWINAMQDHGYKGAFEMAATVDYLFAYDATTELIDDYQYQQVSDALIFDEQNQAFLQQNNPNALEEMAERLLEAHQRGLWQDDGGRAQALQDLLLDMDAQAEGAG